MSIPVILKILAEKDASVDAITNQVKALLAASFDGASGSARELTKSLSNPENAQAVQKVAKEFQQLDRDIEKAAKTSGSFLDKMAQQASTAKPILPAAGSNSGSALSSVAAIRSGIAEAASQPFAGSTISQVNAIVASLKLWEQENATLIASEKTLKDEVAKAHKEASAAISASEKSMQGLSLVGTATGTGMAAMGAALLGVSAAVTKVAIDFEQLQAKLVTLKGSNEDAARSFAFAKAYAAKTPFDVQGIVAATVTLEAYKQKAEVTLPQVAALASGLGRPIQETALVLGKALSGSHEGFESLRNEYGISSADLKKYGAELDKTGGLLIHNESQIAKVGAALSKIIDLRFGTAIARQAATAGGALSNAGDSAKNLADSFGSTLLPMLSTGLRTFSSVVDSLNSGIPQGTKAAIAALAVLGGGALTAAGGATLLATALVAMNAQLAATGINTGIVGAGLRTTNLALTGTSMAATAAGTALKFLVNTTLGLTLSVIGLGASIAQLKFDAMQAEAERTGLMLKEQSKKIQDTVQDLRKYIAVVNEAGKIQGINLKITGDVGKQAGEIESAFKRIKSEDLVRYFAAQGETTETLKRKQADLAGTLDGVHEKYVALKTAIELVQDHFTDQASFDKAREALKSVGLYVNDGSLKLDSMKAALRGVTAEEGRIAALSQILGQLVGTFTKFALPLENATKEAERLKDFLKFSEEVGSAQSLTAALGEVERQLRTNASLPGIQGNNRDQLVAKLADSSTEGPLKKAIETQLSLFKAEKDFQDKLKELNKKGLEDRLDAEDLVLRRKLALGKASLADEIALIKQHLAEVQVGSQKEVELQEKLKTLTDKQTQERITADTLYFRKKKALGDEDLAGEVAYFSKRLAEVKKGSAEEIELLEKLAAAKKAIQEKDAQAARESLHSQFAGAQSKVDALKEDPDSTPQQRVAALDQVLARLESWKQANQPIINGEKEKFKQVKAYYEQVERATQLERGNESAKILAGNLQILKGNLAEIITSSVGNVAKLESVERAIALVKQAQTGHLIAQKAAELELLQLGKEKLATEKAIAAEKRAQAQELLSLDQKNKEQEIQILQERQANGENVDRELLKAQKDRFKGQLDLLDQAKEDYIKSHGESNEAIAHAESKFAKERENLERAETLRQYQELQKRVQQHGASLDQQDQRYQQSQQAQSSGGGQAGFLPNSAGGPLFSGGQGGKGVNDFSGIAGFSLGNFGDKVKSQYTADADPGFLGNRADQLQMDRSPYQLMLQRTKFEAERNIKLGIDKDSLGNNKPANAGDEIAKMQTQNVNTNYNATINVNGQTGGAMEREFMAKLVPMVEKYLGTRQRNDRLRQGQDRPPIGSPGPRNF